MTLVTSQVKSKIINPHYRLTRFESVKFCWTFLQKKSWTLRSNVHAAKSLIVSKFVMKDENSSIVLRLWLTWAFVFWRHSQSCVRRKWVRFRLATVLGTPNPCPCCCGRALLYGTGPKVSRIHQPEKPTQRFAQLQMKYYLFIFRIFCIFEQFVHQRRLNCGSYHLFQEKSIGFSSWKAMLACVFRNFWNMFFS